LCWRTKFASKAVNLSCPILFIYFLWNIKHEKNQFRVLEYSREVNYMADRIKNVIELMSTLEEDTSIPKNIRKAINEAKARMTEEGDIKVRTSNAVYLLDSVSEDINMPTHARTQIWTILSELETIREE